MEIGLYVLIALVLLALVVVKKTIVIIPQSETRIIERLGRYYATLKPGINIIIPFIDQTKTIVAMRRGSYTYTSSIDLREQVYDFDRQNVITKDNIQMQINALLYFQIVDPFKSVYEINNLPNAIEKLTQTTLRNIIGEMELDQTLTSRDTINTKLRAVLDDATNKVETGVRIRYMYQDPDTGEEEEILIANTESRKQQQNRENAMRLLKSQLYDRAMKKRLEAQAKIEAGKKKIEWGSQIRSYVFDDKRVKDHRTNYQTSDVDGVMNGKLDGFIKAYLMEFPVVDE